MIILGEQKGQGMLEMIVAIGIIVTGLTGALSLTTSTLNATSENETRVIGTNLARESIEAARHTRDSNWLAGGSWNGGLVGVGDNRTAIPTFASGIWSFDFSVNKISDDGARVHQDGNGFLSHQAIAGSKQTNYRRLVTFSPICETAAPARDLVVRTDESACTPSETEVGTDVSVEVTWTVSGRARHVQMEQELYDWR